MRLREGVSDLSTRMVVPLCALHRESAFLRAVTLGEYLLEYRRPWAYHTLLVTGLDFLPNIQPLRRYFETPDITPR